MLTFILYTYLTGAVVTGVSAGTLCYQHDKKVGSCATIGTATGALWPYVAYEISKDVFK